MSIERRAGVPSALPSRSSFGTLQCIQSGVETALDCVARHAQLVRSVIVVSDEFGIGSGGPRDGPGALDALNGGEDGGFDIGVGAEGLGRTEEDVFQTGDQGGAYAVGSGDFLLRLAMALRFDFWEENWLTGRQVVQSVGADIGDVHVIRDSGVGDKGGVVCPVGPLLEQRSFLVAQVKAGEVREEWRRRDDELFCDEQFQALRCLENKLNAIVVSESGEDCAAQEDFVCVILVKKRN